MPSTQPSLSPSVAPNVFHKLPVSEWNALHDLYLSLNGSKWNWNSYAGMKWHFPTNYITSFTSKIYLIPNPCSELWQGVVCSCFDEEVFYDDLNGRIENVYQCTVLNLNLGDMNLVGRIPQSIAHLANMTHLYLLNNSLTGVLPATLWSLSKLELLSLSLNKFNCFRVSSHITQLIRLQYLYLANSNITGVLPTFLARLIEVCV
jgi:Leucine-rich repeat (LRR) protein